MKIKLATKEYEKEILFLFQENLDEKNPAVYSREFFCPFGLKSAIPREQVMIVLNDKEEVVAGLRFYLRKRDGVVSVYQFVIDKKYRRQDLIKKILNKIEYNKFEVLCPVNIKFNKYYEKTGWVLDRSIEKFNYWILEK